MLTTRVLPPILRSSCLQPLSVQLLSGAFGQDPNTPLMNMDHDYHQRASEREQIISASPQKPPSSTLTRSASSPSPARRSKTSSEAATEEPTFVRRLTRKRAASLVHIEENKSMSEDDDPTYQRSSNSAPSAASEEISGHICLCQPEPKIPRPRNAFILYRQYHQQAVVARHPGLANPEISKIIGEQWQAETGAVKNEWKALADEEKARHQQQYPEYRYQPRRNGKAGALSENPSGEHTTVEKYRCPRCGGRSIRTPTSPFPTPHSTPLLPPPRQSPNSTSTTQYLPMMNNLSLESSQVRRGRPGPSNLSNIQVPVNTADTAMYSPISPDSKRRRYNIGGYAPGSARRIDGGPYPYPPYSRRDSLPPIRQSPPNTGAMPPPRTPRRTDHDIGLTVSALNDQSRSVEAMVMSVPFQVKIKVLGRITPPLKTLSNTNPTKSVRGAIVAIEGEDTTAVQELSHWLDEFLTKDKEYHVKFADPPKGPDADKADIVFSDYLDVIRDWHERSKDMVEFITTAVHTAESNDGDDEEIEGSDKSSDKGSTTTAKPILLLPTYQLRASDVYALRVPILDSYSPTDHWQWMATLWRGIVGPDLTIYIKDVKGEDLVREKLVELDEDVRCLTVRKEKGSTKLSDSALRRVGFEVSEWIQAVGSGKEGH
ncbi:hypothetical protein AOQ84DRAFT_83015 [Glonium stellatum]|uniref:HMG box domain-containing protein n=1 Tax=Glonium stellatum TaxID=574774 RepID=A0A8E2EX21_9PEZI|nr:hypothetical protein AOQ84DRAFT_83015 [Glonium stellatum]